MQRNEGKAIAFNRRFGRRLPKDVRKRKIIGGEMRERAVIGAKMMDSVDSYCTKVPVTKVLFNIIEPSGLQVCP